MLTGIERVARSRFQMLSGAAAGLPGAMGKELKGAAFWGSLSMRLALVEAPAGFDTAATDGESIFCNLSFTDSLSEAALVGLMAHEVAHVAGNHMGRRGNRDPRLWNEACDYAINPMLLEHGFTLPEGALVDPRFDGMSPEQIYTILDNEKQARNNPPKPQPPQGQQGQQQPQQGQGQQPQPQQQPGQQQAPQQPQQGQQGQPQQQGAQQGQPQPGQGQQPGQPQQGPGQGQPGAQGQQGQPGQGNGSGQPQPGQQAPQGHGSGTGQPGQPGQAGQPGQGQPTAAPDPGRCGGVLDAPQGRAAELAKEWQGATLQAAAITAKSEGCGMGEGSTARIVKELRRGRVNWTEELRDIISDCVTTDDSWAKGNRRFLSSGLYLPGQAVSSRGHIVIGIDNSGSLPDKALQRFFGELQAMLDDSAADKFTVVHCDFKMRQIKEYEPGDKLQIKAPGGGGTDFRPVMDWTRKNGHDVAALLYFTDLDATPDRFGTDPGVPVIWVNWHRPRKVPFGRVIQLDPHDK